MSSADNYYGISDPLPAGVPPDQLLIRVDPTDIEIESTDPLCQASDDFEMTPGPVDVDIVSTLPSCVASTTPAGDLGICLLGEPQQNLRAASTNAFDHGGRQLILAGWFNPVFVAGPSQEQTLIAKVDGSADEWLLTLSNDGRVVFTTWNGPGKLIATHSGIMPGQWYFVHAVRWGTILTGRLAQVWIGDPSTNQLTGGTIATSGFDMPFSNQPDITMGLHDLGTGQTFPYEGRLDQWGIWADWADPVSMGPSPAEIWNNRMGVRSGTAPTDGLVAFWDFEETGSPWVDAINGHQFVAEGPGTETISCGGYAAGDALFIEPGPSEIEIKVTQPRCDATTDLFVDTPPADIDIFSTEPQCVVGDSLAITPATQDINILSTDPTMTFVDPFGIDVGSYAVDIESTEPSCVFSQDQQSARLQGTDYMWRDVRPDGGWGKTHSTGAVVVFIKSDFDFFNPPIGTQNAFIFSASGPAGVPSAEVPRFELGLRNTAFTPPQQIEMWIETDSDANGTSEAITDLDIQNPSLDLFDNEWHCLIWQPNADNSAWEVYVDGVLYPILLSGPSLFEGHWFQQTQDDSTDDFERVSLATTLSNSDAPPTPSDEFYTGLVDELFVLDRRVTTAEAVALANVVAGDTLGTLIPELEANWTALWPNVDRAWEFRQNNVDRTREYITGNNGWWIEVGVQGSNEGLQGGGTPP